MLPFESALNKLSLLMVLYKVLSAFNFLLLRTSKRMKEQTRTKTIQDDTDIIIMLLFLLLLLVPVGFEEYEISIHV